MVLTIRCDEKEIRKRIKRWKKLGFDYFEITKTFESINELENSLKTAIGVSEETTKKLAEKKKQMDSMYEFLTTQERVK